MFRTDRDPPIKFPALRVGYRKVSHLEFVVLEMTISESEFVSTRQ
jgi:hypothetical protein